MPVRTYEATSVLPTETRKLVLLLELREAIDVAIEEGMTRRESLGEVLSRMLPAVCAKAGAVGAFVESYGEDLEPHVFEWPVGLVIPERAEVFARTREERRERAHGDSDTQVVVAQHLDVAGTWFGSAGFVFAKGSPIASDLDHAFGLLNALAEVLDNFLYTIRAARERHNIMMDLAQALRHRVLGEGLALAISILHRATPLDRTLLVFLAEEQASSMLHVQVYEGDKRILDTMDETTARGDVHELRRLGLSFLREGNRDILARFGMKDAQEEVLINGVTKSVIVGKVVVASGRGAFNTYDREILGGFAGFIRQRVVDFNKEWRRLAAAFRPDDVSRLIGTDDYEQRYLSPREAEVAILYVDIAGFTKLSEETLKTPAAVAELVEVWSRDAVELVWAHGGVFDKMIGDCVLALFGPPFYDATPEERLAAALRCAKDIRAMTQKLPDRPAFAHLKEQGVAVSTGVNLAPLFVGAFGPNANFTGFSSGMNNTARLQGCAKRDQILVMNDAVARLGDAAQPGGEFAFGDVQSASVKNVAMPLQFRDLLG